MNYENVFVIFFLMKKTAWLKFPPPGKQLYVANAKMCCHN